MSLQNVFLLQINGRDHHGLTKDLTHTLSEFNAEVLDIGQSVIHDTLALGILIALEQSVDPLAVKQRLSEQYQNLPIELSWQAIGVDEYESWVSEQGKNRYIATILSRSISAAQLQSVSDLITDSGLNIESIDRLSGRVSLNESASTKTSVQHATAKCIELSLRGEPKDKEKLRKGFLNLASELNVDIAFQMDDAYRRNRRLVVFDMDSTLIEAEVIDELAIEAGVGDQVIAITEQAMRGELDFKESFSRRLALLKGLSESRLAGIAERLKLTEGAERLISTLNVLGYKTAIVSGGFSYFGEIIRQRLNMDYVFANQLEIVDGEVTGRVRGEVVDADKKAELVRQLAEQENISLQQVIAIGDGANDLKMLSTAGLGIAFRAKPLVKETAEQAISTFGLDGVLYLMGIADKDRQELMVSEQAKRK